MIELVHLKSTHTYAAARRLSGILRGLCYVDILSVSDLFEPPEERRGVEFPRKSSIRANGTTTIVQSTTAGVGYSRLKPVHNNTGSLRLF